MQAGWREFFKRRFGRHSSHQFLGIEFGDQGLHLSLFKHHGGRPQWFKQHSLPQLNWQKSLKAFVSQHKLENTVTHVAFSIGKYQILKLDKPKVETGEVAAALQWSVKEFIPDAQDPIIDYFDAPGQSGAVKKINVVAIERSEVLEVVEGISEANLYLQSIGIEELATCNLVENNDDAVITLLQEPGEEVCLNIVRNQQLYFARRLKGFENMSTFSQDELKMGLLDSLSVEIQRSMDYFESQLRQPPVKKILVSLDSPNIGLLCDLIKENTFKPVEPFYPDLDKTDDLAFEQASYTSLGAALSATQAQSEAVAE